MIRNRQQILLSLLALIALFQIGDWVLNSLIQGPLQTRRARTEQLNGDITKAEKLLAETRAAGRRIDVWQKQSLPSDPEVARTVYRSWLLSLVKSTQLRNAVVDSGSPGTRRAKDGTLLFRSMPFSVRCRGSLSQFNAFLFEFTKAGHLHQLSSISLNPVAATGQFDISLGIETLLVNGRRGDTLSSGKSQLLAFNSLSDYHTIVKDNIFGVGIDHSDPMKQTFVTAITFSDGIPEVWITEEQNGKTIRVGVDSEFRTVALHGRIVEVHDQEVVIETSGDRLRCLIGRSFAEATAIPLPTP